MELIHIQERYARSVAAELEKLLDQARRGEIIGLGFTTLTADRAVRAGLSGVLAKDRLKGAGILFGAAMSAAYSEEDT